jgi:hypothetical protein
MQLLLSFSDKKHAAAAIFIEQERALFLSLSGRLHAAAVILIRQKHTAAAFLVRQKVYSCCFPRQVGSTRSMQLMLSSFGRIHTTAAIPFSQEACAAAIRQKHATAAISMRQDACSCCFLHQVRSTISMQLLLSSSGRKHPAVVIPIGRKACAAILLLLSLSGRTHTAAAGQQLISSLKDRKHALA